MVRIFQDKQRKNEIASNNLFEGGVYYLDLSAFNENEIEYWIKNERLEKFIEYIPGNNLATIKLINVVGNVNLFGTVCNVASRKFGEDKSGEDQFKELVQELSEISNKLNILNTGVAHSNREIDYSRLNQNDFNTFDYFFQLWFDFPEGKNLPSFLERVFQNPNRKIFEFEKEVSVARSKRVSNSFFKNISKKTDFALLEENSALSNTSIARRINEISGRPYFPAELDEVVKDDSLDTMENRFIKFMLQDLRTLCVRLESRLDDDIILTKIRSLKSEVDRTLGHSFFRHIGRMHYLPQSSSVLLNKSGYKEIFNHYVKSKYNFRSIIHRYTSGSLRSGLKDIATLYEIWTFFKIGEKLFPEQFIKQTFTNTELENGEFIKGIIWSTSNAKLNYNKTYSRSNKESYSLALRPDISLEIGESKYLFDAKYKYNSRETGNSEEPLKFVKSEDIHKMHAYLDAISNAKFSVALYPGNAFVFYDKEEKSVAHDPSDASFSGVGAIPLSPGADTTILDGFLERLRWKFEE